MVLDFLFALAIAGLYYLRIKELPKPAVKAGLTQDFPGRTDDVPVPAGEDRRDYVAWWRENEAWHNLNEHDPRIDPDWLKASNN